MQKIFAHKGLILLSISLILFIILACFAIAPVYSYSQLDTDFNAQSSSPEFNINAESVAKAILYTFLGDLSDAAQSIVKGLSIKGEIIFTNNALIPLYLPHLEHEVIIEGKKCPDIIETESMWVGPNNSKSQPFSLLIQAEHLPEIAFSAIAQGGTVNIEIISRISFGAYSITKNTYKTANISNSLASYKDTIPSIMDYHFDPGEIKAGEMATASISIAGGSTGECTLRIIKDTDLLPDEQVVEYFFYYDGESITESHSFIFTSSGTYHMELLYNEGKIWSQPRSLSE